MDHDSFERFTALDFSSHEPTASKADVFDTYIKVSAGKVTDPDIQLIASLKVQHPELIVTAIPLANLNLLNFAAAGYATADLDEDDEAILRWRGYIPPPRRGDGDGFLTDAYFFAKYHYKWGNEDFILYTISIGFSQTQYLLKEPRGGEKVQGHSRVTDALLSAVGKWQSIVPDALYVYDSYWYKSEELWKEVQKASWDKVILDPNMKKELVSVCDTFFDSEATYKEYGCPWKRGLIFHGPPGNGKTISIKALMHSMYDGQRKVPCLYVKSAPYTYMIADIFALARSEAPCLLIFEDMDTIVTPTTRSYFFNEVDGVASNNGILMIASTNYLDRLDPGLTKRPSRFDRKYLFPMPSEDERILYCEFWRGKIQGKPIEFPSKLCPAIAGITDGFSFAYLQELFIASMLIIARGDAESSDDKHDDDLNSYKLWRVIKKQARILREDMDSSDGPEHPSSEHSSSPRLAEPLAPGKCSLPYQAFGIENAPMQTQHAGASRVEERPLHALNNPVFGGQRLTSAQAYSTLLKGPRLASKVWEWDSTRSDLNTSFRVIMPARDEKQ